MRSRFSTFLVSFGLLAIASSVLPAQRVEVRRTADGKPDLSGTYNAATLTPVERPEELGDKLFMTRAEAEKIAADQQAFVANALKASDPDREAPPVGGAAVVGFEENRAEGEALGAGNVGGYNWFWVDPGSAAFEIDGQFRTSILTDPPNGRYPPLTPEALAATERYSKSWLSNDGTAWWLGQEGPGPYDDVELRPLYERCILGFSEGPPMLPSLYNNFITVVQGTDHIVIVNEMIHDARIIRMQGEHDPADMRSWLGDSIGHWDGDTLVIETRNFRDQTGLLGASGNLTLVERISALDGEHLQYGFTVHDPSVWTAPFSGDYVWPKSQDRLYEYACHEGNHSLDGIMKGARLLEAEARAKGTSGSSTSGK